MHCMDSDYSVFSILPPYNTVNAQVIRSVGTTSSNMVTTLMTGADGVWITYEAVADSTLSINTTSVGKTNFWTYAQALYGTALAPDTGLTGLKMPGTANTPQRFIWDASNDWFAAAGIPIVPKDDAGRKNFYPMLRLKAYDSTNTLRASADVAVPVSDEMDCRACHASGSKLDDAKPYGGWVNEANAERDFRLNILKKHDEILLGTSLYQASLVAKNYREDGLFQTVSVDGKPILCAACHASEALPGNGYDGVSPLTQALHSSHATVIDPDNGLRLGAESNRSACYQCHPGSTTRCLRGAMGSAVASDGSMQMQCQSCHGTMRQVGSPLRTGWLDEPSCQQCHTGTAVSNNGQIRYTSVFDQTTGQPRVAVNQTFATNPNTPATGKSLYQFSSGHGGLKCQACHGSTHAEYPAGANDNVQSNALQGHVGVLSECTTCHAVSPSRSRYAGGPHGLHPMGTSWGENHDDYSTGCTNCHGSDRRGTVLSDMQKTRSLKRKDVSPEYLTFWRGYRIGCWSCHNGTGGSGAPPASPTLTASAISAAGAPVRQTITLSATTAVPRIITQPAHGTVALTGTTLTYYPEPGYSGTDSFTLAARNSTNSVDSNLVTVNITPANYLLWRGDGTTNAWAVGGASNWLVNGATPGVYADGGAVTIDDTGSASPAIALNGALAPGAIVVNANRDYTFGGTGSLGGTASLTKFGAGTLTINPSNTFSGASTIRAGTVRASALAITAGASSLGNSAGAVALGDTLTKGTLVYTGNTATFTRGLTVAAGGGQLDAATSGQTLSVSTGGITANGPLTFGGEGIIQVNSVISGSGGLIKTGGGRLIVNNNMTFTGPENAVAVAINQGIIKMSGRKTFFANRNVSVSANAVWLLDGTDPTVGQLTGKGLITSEWKPTTPEIDVLTVGGGDSTSTFGGMIAGGNGTDACGIALTKTGTGTVTLTGENTYAGTTTISAGTLQVGAGGNVGTLGTGNVVNNATLVFNRGDNNYASLVVPGAISGSGNLIKDGAGLVSLTANNHTYTGNTTVLAGTLCISGTVASGGSATVRAAGGGTLRLCGGTVTAGTVQIDGGGSMSGHGTINGNLVNAGTVTADTGAGFTINGSVTNSGTMRLLGGTALQVSGMFVNNGLLDLITGSQTLPANFQNNGTVLDSSSVRVSDFVLNTNEVRFSVVSAVGHNYQLQRAESLAAEAWQNVGTAVPGTGQEILFTDPTGALGAKKRFYRVMVSP